MDYSSSLLDLTRLIPEVVDTLDVAAAAAQSSYDAWEKTGCSFVVWMKHHFETFANKEMTAGNLSPAAPVAVVSTASLSRPDHQSLVQLVVKNMDLLSQLASLRIPLADDQESETAVVVAAGFEHSPTVTIDAGIEEYKEMEVEEEEVAVHVRVDDGAVASSDYWDLRLIVKMWMWMHDYYLRLLKMTN